LAQTRFLLPLACRALMRLEVIGAENVPRSGAVILAANHLDNWDPYVCNLSMRHRAIHHFARADGMSSRCLGTYWRMLGSIPANREGLGEALGILRSGGAVGIYPEGKISQGLRWAGHGAAMLALRSGAPVVPVAVWGTERVHPYSPFARPCVTIRYGSARVLGRGCGSPQDLSDALMLEIADMLPPCYRGVYAAERLRVGDTNF
jgi:1-acyl-sn-glycerol-3-phosphate acyltransferase